MADDAKRVPWIAASSRDVLLFLVAFRMLNALLVDTFFQPDEYFQSLEPAWQIAFGRDSGAWITWEWHHRLRSSIHPYAFAALYKLADKSAEVAGLTASSRAELLLNVPKLLQAVVAAIGDYYTWKLAQRTYGDGSDVSWVALAMTVCNPWNWFCSTRTLSNCLETTLTVVALESWSRTWSSFAENKYVEDPRNSRVSKPKIAAAEKARFRRSLILAAIACVLRPTNVLIWICLSAFALAWGNSQRRWRLVKEAISCGALVLATSALCDRAYYQAWTFPPLKFVYFNVAQSLAVFYGRNRTDYYLTEGLPLLLTSYLPFAAIGLYRAFLLSSKSIRFQLATITAALPLVLSLISHKEVRFIYPLLPSLHVLSAPSLASFALPIYSKSLSRKALLGLLVGLNVAIGLFATRYHQPGPLRILSYLRHEYESRYLPQSLPPADTIDFVPGLPSSNMTVGFLMPCHSTPWRSHLVHEGIKAWALGCEPPVHIPPGKERAKYLDEADRFYADPKKWILRELGRPLPREDWTGRKAVRESLGAHGDEGAWDGKQGKKIWSEYLVFFEGVEDVVADVAGESGYRECWRVWNSWFHDDWRRQGDIVVWCTR